jgi:hypothetical protein
MYPACLLADGVEFWAPEPNTWFEVSCRLPLGLLLPAESPCRPARCLQRES